MGENLPSSFTLCTAFIIESWNQWVAAMLFELQDDNGESWSWLRIYAAESNTQFSLQLDGSTQFVAKSKFLFYPLQWTRVCFSLDSNTSEVRLVVDNEVLMEKAWKVRDQPKNLKIVLGMSGSRSIDEWPGRTTNLNVFSSALNLEKMKAQTSPGKEECGLAGDFLSWGESLDEEQWTLHSRAII